MDQAVQVSTDIWIFDVFVLHTRSRRRGEIADMTSYKHVSDKRIVS